MTGNEQEDGEDWINQEMADNSFQDARLRRARELRSLLRTIDRAMATAA